MSESSTVIELGAVGFSGDPLHSMTLPSIYYTSPEIADKERENLFFRSWLYVGHVCDIPSPGSYFTTRIFDQGIVVVRGQDMAVRAFYNVCRHRGHELLQGSGTTARIVCPYHAWRYGLDGRLHGVRNEDHVKGFKREDFPLSAVRIETLAGLVFVNLDLDAAPLAAQAAGLDTEIREFAPNCDELARAHRTSHVMACNWKIAVENWSECYHCAVVHKPLASEFIDFSTFRVHLHPLYQRQRMMLRENVVASAAVENTGPATGEQASWTVLPNLGIQIVHGGYLMTSLWRPIDADHCEFIEEWYLPSAEPDDAQRELFRFRAEYTQPEDVAVCEGVQRGLHSRGYRQGRLMVDSDFTELSEHGSHHIQHWVARMLKVPHD